MEVETITMSHVVSKNISEKLSAHNQSHLLRWWDGLPPKEQDSLEKQLKNVDFELVERLFSECRDGQDDALAGNLGQRAQPPAHIVRLPKSASEQAEWDDAKRSGEEILAAGKVGVILVAGGQGTRLGFPHPKGMYPLGPVSDKSMFQLLAEQALARSRQAGAKIPYYVMTSRATHAATVNFFQDNRYFGLSRHDVYFFRQGNMPAVDDRNGRLLLDAKGSLSTSPNGHGGLLAALSDGGLLSDMRLRGIEYLFYHQVDNPTAIVCDPTFIGHHVACCSEISTKVVEKKGAEEKMGVVVDVDGQTQIIEYSDLPLETARKTDPSGGLLLWAGSTAIHLFNRQFLERILDEKLALPYHLAHKAVPHIDQEGNSVTPAMPNAYKFEQFIFDVMPFAERALAVEADRAREFNPVKNKTGQDSPECVKQAMSAIFRGWLQLASVEVNAHLPIEVSPLFACDADQLREKVEPGTKFSEPVYLQ